MKAEQRKELETNTLADKMGQMMQRVKGGQRRTFLIYAVIVVAAVVGAFIAYRYYERSRVEESQQWFMLYDGAGDLIDQLAQTADESKAGKAAALQRAWILYWHGGIKMLGLNKDGALKNLDRAVKAYGILAEECKEDPVFGPQALLGRAVAQETRAVEDRKHLKDAQDFYEELVNHPKFDKSAEAKFAQKRLEILKNADKRAELAATYASLQGPDMLDIQAPLQFNPHQGLPGFPKEKLP